MHNRLIYTFLMLLPGLSLFAQEPDAATLQPCGAPPGIDPWLRAWQEHPEQLANRSTDTLYVGIQVHLVARNNATGRLAPERLLDAFCRLNEDFAATGIRFYFKNDWNLPNNTAWYSHSTIPQGIDMMLTNNVPDALNTYFVSDPAGNCGYNLPYAGVAIAHGCSYPDEHTWAHEIGHALSLPHTFIGWENTPYSFANPTPDIVTYDYTYFHDTIDTTVPAPLDTALVERLDGSNCGIAADLFCDTRPDYLNYRWACDDQGESLVMLKDQNGATFKADGTLFMSYSADVCSNRFSDEQLAAMRGNLLTEKVAWLSPGPPAADITDQTTLLSPTGGIPTGNVNVELHWTAVPGATHYIVQVSRFSNYLVKEYNAVVTDTFFTAATLPAGFTYYWRVRPFNYWFACTEFTQNESFMALQSSGASIGSSTGGWRCYPTRLQTGQALTLEIPENSVNQRAQYEVFDAAGRLLMQGETRPESTKISLQLPVEQWPSGLYRLVWINEKQVSTATLLLGEF